MARQGEPSVRAGKSRWTFAGQVKAYNVPAVCVRAGIQKAVEEGDKDETFRSRRVYVKQRLPNLEQPELFRIAEAFLREYAAATLAETVSEMTTHDLQRVSPLVRSDVLKVLNRLDRLFGNCDLIETLCEIFRDDQIRSSGFEFFDRTCLAQNIVQHYFTTMTGQTRRGSCELDTKGHATLPFPTEPGSNHVQPRLYRQLQADAPDHGQTMPVSGILRENSVRYGERACASVTGGRPRRMHLPQPGSRVEAGQ